MDIFLVFVLWEEVATPHSLLGESFSFPQSQGTQPLYSKSLVDVTLKVNF